MHGGLRLLDLVFVFEHDAVATAFEANKLLAQQARREDRRDGVFGEFILLEYMQSSDRLVGVSVKTNGLHPTHDNAGSFHRRTRFQRADVFEAGLNFVAVSLLGGAQQIADFECEKREPGQADQDKHADPQINNFFIHIS